MKTNKIYSNKNKQKQRLIQIKNDFQVRKLSSTAGGRTSGGSEKRTIFWGGDGKNLKSLKGCRSSGQQKSSGTENRRKTRGVERGEGDREYEFVFGK